MKGLKLGR